MKWIIPILFALLLVPISSFSANAQTQTITGLISVPPDGYEISTVEKFGTNYENFVDESGYIYRIYDMWSDETITGLINGESRTLQQYNNSWHFEVNNFNEIITINDMIEKEEYPKVTETYAIEQISEDEFTYSTHIPYINDNGIWKPYILNEDENVIQIEVNGGKFVFDKNQGALTIFDENNNTVIDSDSYVVRTAILETDVWNNLNINNEIVSTELIEDDNIVTISFIQENDEGKFTTQYIIGNGNVKTTAYFLNYIYDNHKFAFTQTLNLPDSEIILNDSVIDLNNYVGQSFPREVLEENMDLILQIKDMYYNSGLGFENLWSVNVTTPTKVSLDYANVEQTQTGINETVELDPSWSHTTTGYAERYVMFSAYGIASTTCDPTWTAYMGNISNYFAFPASNATNNNCFYPAVEFDITTIPTGAIISNVDMSYDITNSSNPRNCDFVAIDATRATATASSINEFTTTGTVMLSNDSSCASGLGSYTANFGSAGVTELSSDITVGNSKFVVGVKPNTSTVRDSVDHQQIFSNQALQVTYTQPPSTPTNLTTTQTVPNQVDLSWTASNSNSDYIVSSSAVTSDGTNYGATSGATGIIGNGWDFDGTNDYVNIPSIITPNTGYTWSMWANLGAPTGTSMELLGRANYVNLMMSDEPTYGQTWASVYFNGVTSGTGYNTMDSGWHHYVGATDCVGYSQWQCPTTIYMDGASIGTGVAGYRVDINYFLGARNNNGTPALFTDGVLDEVTIYHRPLTSSEVSTLYNSGNGSTPDSISTTGLAQYYNFEQTGSTLTNMAVTVDPLTYNLIRDGTTVATGITATTTTNVASVGTNYNYNVSATTPVGSSSNSNTSNITTWDKPDAITNLSATFNDPNVDLTFTTPANNGSAITSFKVYRDVGSGYSLYDTVNGSSLTTYQDTNPTFGVINYYKINAVNGVAEANDSNVSSTLAGVPPDAPSVTLSHNPANLEIDVAIINGASMGTGTFTQWNVERSPDGTTWTAVNSPTTTPYTDTVPSVGVWYYRATTETNHGVSGYSGVNSITHVDPLAPNVDSVTFSNTANLDATINLSNNNLGSGSFSSWSVERSADGTTNWSVVGTSTGTPFTDTTIPNGGTWYYKATVTTPHGTSPYSTVTNGSTVDPDAPLNLTTTINDVNGFPLTVSLDWDVPLNAGTGTITQYEILRGTTLVDTISQVNTDYEYTMPLPGTFSHTIRAISTHGVSADSNSASITTPTYPDAVTDLAISTYTDTSVTLTWSIPNSNGSTIIDYDVLRTTGGNTVTFSNVVGNGYVDSTAIPQTAYVYEVFVRNNVGFSTISNQGIVTTFGVPDAPVLTATTYDNDRIDLSWNTPNDYGSAITHYILEYESPVGNGYNVLVANTGVSNAYSVTGLSSLQEYGFRITAVNQYGNSPTGVDTAWTLSDAPTNLIVLPDSTTSQLTLDWTAPNNVGVTGYMIERETGIGNGWSTIVADTGNTNTQYQDTGLVFNIFYNYRVSTVTPVNVSIPGNTYAQTTFHLPDPVISLTASEGSVGVDLSWSPPANPYGTILGYTIYKVTAPGTVATATATLSTTLDQIDTITITDGGTQYVTAPTVTISVPGGVAPYTTATATATLTGGVVTGITITNPGNGYNTIPTVTLSPPVVNTVVSATTTLTPLIADTGSATTSYSIVNVDPVLTYAFAIAPITVHGSTILGAAIDTISPDLIFENLTMNIPDAINQSTVPILFHQSVVGADTNLLLTYDASADVSCEATTPFTTDTTEYPNLSETAIGNNKVTHTFTFQNSENSIVDMYCYDTLQPTNDGQARISQNIIPLKTQFDDFNSNTFGTGNTFAGIPILTLMVVVVGMIGFNRKHPAVAAAVMGGILGILTLLDVIQLEHTAIGGIILIIAVAFTYGKNKR